MAEERPTAYVAGSIHERERAKLCQRIVRDRGYDVPVDWTQPVFEEMTPRQRARGCCDAAAKSDLFVLCVPEQRERGAGCYVEFGVALGSLHYPEQRIIAVGTGRSSDFFTLPGVLWVSGPAGLVYMLSARDD